MERVGGVSILERVRALLGTEAVDLTAERDGVPRVAPPTIDAVALLLGTAHAEGWRIRLEGAGTWMPGDGPADLALTTRRLDQIVTIQPQDLMTTVEAGLGFDLLRNQLADRGTWLGIDAPGAQGRTIGSILATATAGPLRHGFGAVREHVLGLTVVTGDGRIIESGGRVVKNVAGYDLTKLQVGGFGAFGVIVLAHLRLRALPRSDLTAVVEGSRDELARVAGDVMAAGLEPAALELVSPALARRERWTLAIRLAGSAALVAEGEVGLRAATEGRAAELRAEEAAAFWRHAAEGLTARAVTLRLGGVPSATEELLDLIQHQLGDEWVMATPSLGVMRWAGDATAERLRKFRKALAAIEVPLTLERAAWPLRSVVGHFGAYREGVGPLVSGLRKTFDPGERLVVAVSEEDHAG